MSKRLILILALAFVLGLGLAAYAEVQNVKVSGDILLRAIDRRHFTLTKEEKYSASGLTSQVRLRVDADLTNNVSAVVRLINERSWGIEDANVQGGSADVAVDLAYVTLKEFFYSPITLTVGRQELRFGNGLVIGDPDTNRYADEYYVPEDLSLRKAFDAVRLTLNYEPMVVDAIYAKIDEVDELLGVPWWNTVGMRERNDVDLYGINVRYDLSALGFKGATEAYWFSRINRENTGEYGTGTYAADLLKTDTCHTIGLLTYGEIIKNLTGSLEGAFQWGNAANDGINNANAERRAWAVQASLNYDLKDISAISKYSPTIGLMYATFSGDKRTNNRSTIWDPMFEDQVVNTVVNALFPNTAVMFVSGKASCKPIEDLTLSGVYSYYWLNDIGSPWAIANANYVNYEVTGNRHLGHAFDLTATYDYTEDVQFGLHFSYFNPGKALDKAAGEGYKQNARELIGSMKITF